MPDMTLDEAQQIAAPYLQVGQKMTGLEDLHQNFLSQADNPQSHIDRTNDYRDLWLRGAHRFRQPKDLPPGFDPKNVTGGNQLYVARNDDGSLLVNGGDAGAWQHAQYLAKQYDQQLREQYPEVADDQRTKLVKNFADQAHARTRAFILDQYTRHYQENPSAADRAEWWVGWAPYARLGATGAKEHELAQAMEAFQEGHASSADYIAIARAQAAPSLSEKEKEKLGPFLYHLREGAHSTLPLLGEFYTGGVATGGAATPFSLSSEAGLGTNIARMAGNAAVSGSLHAATTLPETFTQAELAHVMSKKPSEKPGEAFDEGEDQTKQFFKAAASKWLDDVALSMGNPFAERLGSTLLRRLAMGGIWGPGALAGEQELKHQLGLAPEGSMLRKLASDDPREREDAWANLKAQVVLFGGLGGVHEAWNKAGEIYAFRKSLPSEAQKQADFQQQIKNWMSVRDSILANVMKVRDDLGIDLSDHDLRAAATREAATWTQAKGIGQGPPEDVRGIHPESGALRLQNNAAEAQQEGFPEAQRPMTWQEQQAWRRSGGRVQPEGTYPVGPAREGAEVLRDILDRYDQPPEEPPGAGVPRQPTPPAKPSSGRLTPASTQRVPEPLQRQPGQTARQYADALEQQQTAAMRELMDARRDEADYQASVFRGFNKRAELQEATARRKAAANLLKALREPLEQARHEAALEESRQTAPAAPQASAEASSEPEAARPTEIEPAGQIPQAPANRSGVPTVAGQPVMDTGVPGREQTGVPGYTLQEQPAAASALEKWILKQRKGVHIQDLMRRGPSRQRAIEEVGRLTREGKLIEGIDEDGESVYYPSQGPVAMPGEKLSAQERREQEPAPAGYEQIPQELRDRAERLQPSDRPPERWRKLVRLVFQHDRSGERLRAMLDEYEQELGHVTPADVAQAERERDEALDDASSRAGRGPGGTASLRRGPEQVVQEATALGEAATAAAGAADRPGATAAGPAQAAGAGREHGPGTEAAAALRGEATRYQLTREDRLRAIVNNPRASPFLRREAEIELLGGKTLYHEIDSRGGIEPESVMRHVGSSRSATELEIQRLRRIGKGSEKLPLDRKALQSTGLPLSLFRKGGLPLDEWADEFGDRLGKPVEAAGGNKGTEVDARDWLLRKIQEHFLLEAGRVHDAEMARFHREQHERQLADEFVRQHPQATQAEIDAAVKAFLERGGQVGQDQGSRGAPADAIDAARRRREPGEDEWEESSAGKSVREVAPGVHEIEPGVYFSPRSTRAVQPGGGTAGRAVGQFDLIRTIDELLDAQNYTLRQVPGGGALFDALSRHIETSKLSAGDAQKRVHEVAHLLAVRHGLETDPARLPADVVKGLQQFDYVQGRPASRVTMMEGFAEWLRMREAGQLKNLTPQQQAAAAYAERFIQSQEGLAPKLDRIRSLFDAYNRQSPVQQYAGTISTTNQPAPPVGLTRGERVQPVAASLGQQIMDRVENDLGVLGRLVKSAVAKGMSATSDAAQAMQRALALRYQGRQWAAQWADHGYPEIQPDGTWKPASKSYGQVIRRLTAEEARDGGDYDVYAKAKETVGNFEREWQRKKEGRTDERETVTPEQYEEARNVLDDLGRDPDKLRRFEETNHDRVATLNAGLQFLVQIGRFKPETVERWIRDYPDYVSRERVFDEMTEGYLAGRRKPSGWGQWIPSFARTRKMSGEQTRGALETFRERFTEVGALAQQQLVDTPIRELLRQPGMGEWARQMREEEPSDPTKPIWTTFDRGEPVRFMVANQALMDYLLHRQGEGKASVQLANAVARLPFVNLFPRIIKAGATAASPVWHFRNMLPTRDPKVFVQNTINMKSAAELLPWYAQAARILFQGAVAKGAASRPYIELYERLAGDSQRWITQGQEPGEIGRGRGSFQKSWDYDGFAGVAREVIRRLSFGELVPRALELRNQLDALGVNRQTVEHWNETGELPPLGVQVAVLNAAAEVTHNYQRQGIDTRAWNQVIPFLGAHVANLSKYLRNFQTNPKGAATGVAMLLAMRTLYWLWRKNDDDYREQSVGTRNDFYFNTPIGRIRIAGPRGLDVPLGALADEMLRYASRSNPHFDRLASSLGEQVMPGGPEPLSTGARLWFNRRSLVSGGDIVPKSEQGAGFVHNAWHHQLPFLAEQLTGGALSGRTPMNLATLGFYDPTSPHQSVTDYYHRLHQLQDARLFAHRKGQQFTGEAEYQRLHSVEQSMREISRSLRSMPSRQREEDLRQQQIRLARQALGNR
jgi:hypothetical protein